MKILDPILTQYYTNSIFAIVILLFIYLIGFSFYWRKAKINVNDKLKSEGITNDKDIYNRYTFIIVKRFIVGLFISIAFIALGALIVKHTDIVNYLLNIYHSLSFKFIVKYSLLLLLLFGISSLATVTILALLGFTQGVNDQILADRNLIKDKRYTIDNDGIAYFEGKRIGGDVRYKNVISDSDMFITGKSYLLLTTVIFIATLLLIVIQTWFM